ncbi:MAG: hypothetical protein GTN76_02515 [Candidatus Aenigmarchaeota archaeon]|nr:hypothetical protein [Candidatus Aenigmarchaeota archaeon]
MKDYCIICGFPKEDDICPNEPWHKKGRPYDPDLLAKGSFPEPKIGQKILAPSSLYLHRGRDDFCGGMATISRIDIRDCGNPYNNIMVMLEERPGCWYNWNHLNEQQPVLKAKYGENPGEAHKDPDYREEFNRDDGWMRVREER